MVSKLIELSQSYQSDGSKQLTSSMILHDGLGSERTGVVGERTLELTQVFGVEYVIEEKPTGHFRNDKALVCSFIKTKAWAIDLEQVDFFTYAYGIFEC